MAGISDAFANEMLDARSTYYLAIFTVNPSFTAGTGGTEATGGSYARIALTMGAAAARERSNTSGAHEFTVGTNIAAGTYTGFGLYSASSAGTFLGGAAFGASRVLSVTGDKISFAVGAIDITLPNA